MAIDLAADQARQLLAAAPGNLRPSLLVFGGGGTVLTTTTVALQSQQPKLEGALCQVMAPLAPTHAPRLYTTIHPLLSTIFKLSPALFC
jgi:hypothetical protein